MNKIIAVPSGTDAGGLNGVIRTDSSRDQNLTFTPDSPHNNRIPLRGYVMRGRVYAYGEPCPCGGAWRDIKDGVTGDVVNIICEKCFRPPVRFAIDGRSFKNRRGNVGRLFRDKRGDLYYAFHSAHQDLQGIRLSWKDEGPERFDPTKWSKHGRESYKLAECAREWQVHLERSGKSRSYTSHVEIFFRRHVLPELGTLDIREITGDDVERLQLTLKEKGLSRNSVRSALQVLMTLLHRYHYRKQVIDRIPPFPEGWSAVPQIDRWVVDEVQQREMWMRMPSDTHLLMETLCALGCRPSEVCGLKKKDLLPDGRVMIQRSINVYGEEVETKTGKSRSTIISPDLYTRLYSLPILPEGYLFTKSGIPFNPNRLSYYFRNNNRGSNCTLYTFARHSLASRIAREAREEGIRQAAKAIGNTATVAKLHYVQE